MNSQVDGVEKNERIITVGLSPAWDVICRGRGLDWGGHVNVDEQVVRPAGKAMNVSLALAWMGCPSVAAGLWGRDDHGNMAAALTDLGGAVQTRMTAVDGQTRRNITVVDTLHHREMHLRDRRSLVSAGGLEKLGADLSGVVRPGDTCVFAGAMPGGEFLAPTIDLVRACRRSGARIAADTHGPVLKGIADAGLAWLIAPNVDELRELLGSEVENTPAKLAEAGRALLDRVEMALISRGEEGAILVAKAGTWLGGPAERREALSTVGCGDYLLAGFLAGFRETSDPRVGLARGLKAGAARAWGWTESKSWPEVDKEVAAALAPM